MSTESITAQEEFTYLQSEANKIDGLKFLKIFVENIDPEIDPFPKGNKKPLTEAQINRKKKQLKSNILKKVVAVNLDVLQESVYDPKKGIKHTKEYSVAVKIQYQKDSTQEEDFIRYIKAVRVSLDFHISSILQGRLTTYLKTWELKNKEKTSPKGKFKKSGHLVDQTLKYTYPKDNTAQLQLFNSTIEDIKTAGVEITEVVEGIKLSPSEHKVIDSLCKLLHTNSQTIDPKRENYYSGNRDLELTPYGDSKTAIPKIATTLYELTKEYKGEDYVSGKDIENVKQILTELDKRKFLIRYKEETKGKGGEWVKKEYEAFRPLIHIDKATLSYGVNDVEAYKKEETVIVLNPIFTRQIDKKYVIYPNDINRRTMIAYGSHNISEIALRLRDYLMRELSSKHYEPEIGLDRLYHLLAEKWMKESRKKKVKEYTDKAIDTVKALGLLISHEEKRNASGEPKIVFKLNKNWE
jgi:hypothetical protein